MLIFWLGVLVGLVGAMVLGSLMTMRDARQAHEDLAQAVARLESVVG